MIGDIFLCFALQVAFTVGLVFLFGWLISLCNRRFYANFGSRGQLVCYITGCIGTPVHELSHALFCLLFGHKIVEIKLFQIGQDGTLGYVRHAYNRKNLYQRIGNFFIGVAPILCISGILFLLTWLLLPDLVSRIAAAELIDLQDFGGTLANIWNMLAEFFVCAASWRWWVLVLAGAMFALHMTLSGADIRGALGGLVFLLALLLLADCILGFAARPALTAMTRGFVAAGSWLLCLLMLSLLVSLAATGLSFLARIRLRR